MYTVGLKHKSYYPVYDPKGTIIAECLNLDDALKISVSLNDFDKIKSMGEKMLYTSEDNKVSHPSHYQSANGMEVINVIEAFTAKLKGIEATDTGNIIKYACRWKNKNGIQDLEKILWYTQHLIDHLQKLETEEVNINC